MLIVAPATSAPGADLDRHRLARQHRLVDRRGALARRRRRSRSSRPGGRRTGRRPAARRRARAPPRRRAARAPPSRRARAARGSPAPERRRARGLEVAPEQDQRRDHGGDLEVACASSSAATSDDRRPRPGRERADRDQRVHRRGAVARVRAAARWNGQPAQSTTGVASASATHSQPSNCSGGTIASSGERRGQRGRDDQPVRAARPRSRRCRPASRPRRAAARRA